MFSSAVYHFLHGANNGGAEPFNNEHTRRLKAQHDRVCFVGLVYRDFITSNDESRQDTVLGVIPLS